MTRLGRLRRLRDVAISRGDRVATLNVTAQIRATLMAPKPCYRCSDPVGTLAYHVCDSNGINADGTLR